MSPASMSGSGLRFVVAARRGETAQLLPETESVGGIRSGTRMDQGSRSEKIHGESDGGIYHTWSNIAGG